MSVLDGWSVRAVCGELASARRILPAAGIVSLLCCVLPSVAGAHASFRRSRVEPPTAVCPPSTLGHPECLAIRVPSVPPDSPDGVGPTDESSGEGGGYTPAEIRSAYKIPSTGGAGQTVAVVDPYNDPDAHKNLETYREKYGLPECPEKNCFNKVTQKGETIIEEGAGKNAPENNKGWSLEISLDLDMVSATCPECKILLVEAKTNAWANLGEAENEAAKSVNVINDSWAEKEGKENEKKESREKEWEELGSKYFKHSGIPITAASGDKGYGVAVPAGAPCVIAVGGTALKQESKSERGWVEEVWDYPEKSAGTGSGCALKVEKKPAWQHDKGCANRTDNDIAAVGSSNGTPVSMYDTYEEPGWINAGGTSASAPIIAGIEALAEKPAKELGAQIFYEEPNHEFPVTKGDNGTCAPPAEDEYLCTAREGYSGPAGMGAPDGVPTIEVAEDSSPASGLISTSPADINTYYVNHKHEIGWWTNGGHNETLGGSVKEDTSPATMYDSTLNYSWVYYVGTSDEIEYFVWAAGKWQGPIKLGGKVAAGSDPALVLNNPSDPDLTVFYVNTKHEIAYWYYTPAGWASGTFGGSVNENTSPAAAVAPETGYVWVYFVNASNEIEFFDYVSGSWGGPSKVGGSSSVATDSTPVLLLNNASGLNQTTFYVNTKHEIAYWHYLSGWSSGIVGGSVKEDTSPAGTVNTANGYTHVYYVNGSGELADWYFDGKWEGPSALGGDVASNSSPTAVGATNQYVYYANGGGGIGGFSLVENWIGPTNL